MAEKLDNDEFLARLGACQSQLLGYICALVRNLDDAEDVLQQTVLTIWNKLDKYQPERSFTAWALRFVQYHALNHLRARRRRQFHEHLAASLAETAAFAAEPEENDAYRRAMEGCLKDMNQPDRQMVEQCYYEECKVSALAARLGRSAQSVCNSLRRIRMSLLECIRRKVSAGGGP